MLVTNIFTIVFYLLFGSSTSKPLESYTLTVYVTGLESSTGQIICNLHNNESSFPKKYIFRKISIIENNKSTIIFSGLRRGVYAITVFHDKNSNGKMDFNILHIPSEKTGTSNNVKSLFGLPKFKDSKFWLKKNTTIQIEM